MNIECPKCKTVQEVDGEDLPERVCDSEEYECIVCDEVFLIGWHATAEVR